MGPRERLAVALGGALGALGRAALGAVLPAPAPLTTLLVNLSGALLLAWLLARTADPLLRLGLGTGVLGAWTTFSTLGVEVLDLLGDAPLVAALLACASVGGGLLAVRLGARAGERVGS